MKKIFSLFAVLILSFQLNANEDSKSEGKNPKKIKMEQKVPGGKLQKHAMTVWKSSGYQEFLPKVQERYSDEIEKLIQLQKNNPEEARKQWKEFAQKVREEIRKENAPLKAAIKAYRETREDAKLEEVIKLLKPRIDAAFANAKLRLKTAKKDLETVRGMKISQKRAVMQIYIHEIRKCKEFLKKDKEEILKENMNLIKRFPGKKKTNTNSEKQKPEQNKKAAGEKK